jgi:phosphoribosylglycinamide formyltransferase 2
MPKKNKIMLLGSGELGKELVIAAKRLGKHVIAVDKYKGAPAMQVADEFEVISMLNAEDLSEIVKKHKPDIIVPEVEAIRTTLLKDFEKRGIKVVPTAKAAHTTMNRDAIRDLAANKLRLKTAKYFYAESLEELKQNVHNVGFPCVIKPIMSSSGKGQSTVKSAAGLERAWNTARDGARGEGFKIIVEEFISFHLEITLLTVRQKRGPHVFLPPIGHRQEGGDYRESWIPANMKPAQISAAKRMAKKITDELGGQGIFGVEFFVTRNEVYFSELSPRPHDTGMVTLVSHDLSEFDLHMRAMLELPIPKINMISPAASAVILSKKDPQPVKGYNGLRSALAYRDVDVRIFGKPTHRKGRRMGVALAKARSANAAVRLAKNAAARVSVL